MHCKLCLQEAPLCSSHILPEFVYRPLYNEKHVCVLLRSNPNIENSIVRKGVREKLLCNGCERLLGTYESYARDFVYGQPTTFSGCGVRRLEGLDYKKIKLFQLSILWRAGISTHYLFRNTQLGPHEEKVRKLLFSGSPGGALEYPCVMQVLFYRGQAARDLIFKAQSLKLDGHDCHRFLFGGFLWVFYVTSHRLPNDVQSLILREDGSLSLIFNDVENLDFVRTAFAAMAQKREASEKTLKH